MLKSVALTAAFVVGTLVVVRPLADRLLARMQGPHDTPSGRVLSFIMVLALLGAAATESLGMHAVFGAFVIGIAIGDSSRLREHTRTILHDFVAYVFTPVFFATMALRFDFVAAFDVRLVAIVLAIACVAKVGGCAVGARLAGVAWRESAAIGFGMNSRGAMEILLALLALEAGIINQRVFVALVTMAVVTSMISGPALVRLLRPSPSPIATLLGNGAVVLDPNITTRDALIHLLADRLATRLGRPAAGAEFAKTVLAREILSGTGVGEGVAFPHAQVEGLDRPMLAFARVPAGLDFDAPDGEKVILVFLLLTPLGEYDKSLQILSAMARLMSRADVRSRLLGAPEEAKVIADLDHADRPPISTAHAGSTIARRPG